MQKDERFSKLYLRKRHETAEFNKQTFENISS